MKTVSRVGYLGECVSIVQYLNVYTEKNYKFLISKKLGTCRYYLYESSIINIKGKK